MVSIHANAWLVPKMRYVSLLLIKSRVTPIKPINIPRLELTSSTVTLSEEFTYEKAKHFVLNRQQGCSWVNSKRDKTFLLRWFSPVLALFTSIVVRVNKVTFLMGKMQKILMVRWFVGLKFL